MSSWRSWWRWWLAGYVRDRHAPAPSEQQREQDEDMSPGVAASMIRQPTGPHATDHERLGKAARQLQRQIGNRGLQLLAENSGQPVPPGLREQIRPSPADDLTDVRLHTGPEGAEIARRAGAEAVAIGGDVAFGRDAFAPDTDAGRQLLAHELTHTVQAGAGQGHDPASLEREARNGAMPSRASAQPGQMLRQPTQSWSERVRAAQAETDAASRRNALITLVREALTGMTVHIAPARPSNGPVDPRQYQPAPAVNFDFYLEQKQFWQRAGRSGVLGPRTGYFFSDGGRSYAIIGPRAIEASTPVLTRMFAEHELFHASHHVRGGGSSSDQELQTWTNDFTNYFHQVYQARKTWAPLIEYYESASERARRTALTALVTYFNGQPEEMQRRILAWLRRRQRDMADKLLVRALGTRIMPRTPARGAGAPPP